MKQDVKSPSSIARTLVEYLKETGQENLTADVIDKIEEKYRENHIPLKISVTTAIPLNVEEKEYLLKELMFKKSPAKVYFSVNPKIIGGLTIRMGDWFIDASLKNDIHSFKKTLLNP